jgi:aspartyl-tRNA(Asn)/glutamyl-tRNA(Gln) amidotransferase subunit B
LLAHFKESSEDVSFWGLKFESSELAEVINLTNKDELSSTNAKVVIEELFNKWGHTAKIVDALWLRQKNDTWALEEVVKKVVASNQNQLAEYKAWKVTLFGYFVGQCMKESSWAWNPKIFTELLKKYLD